MTKTLATEKTSRTPTTWIVEQIPTPTPELQQCLLHLQKDIQEPGNIFHGLIGFISACDTKEKKLLARGLYENYHPQYGNDFVNYIMANINKHRDLCDFWLELIEQSHPELLQGALNRFLPGNLLADGFFPYERLSQLRVLLDKGLSFDERSYSHEGKSLFLYLALHGSEEMVEPIIPRLKCLPCASLSRQQEMSLLDTLQQINPERYALVKPYYLNHMLQENLPQPSKASPKPKL